MATGTTIATILGVTVIAPATSSPPSAAASVRKTVDSDYTLLRRDARSYVIGTAYRDWTFDAHGDALAGYRWGRAFGDLNTCLWIYEDAVSGDGATNDSCPAARVIPVSAFTNGQIGGGADDGAAVATVAGAGCATHDGVHLTGYGNVRPWQVPSAATAPVSTALTVGSTVNWRYVSKDGAYVMVRDPNAGDTDGSGVQPWYFLPRGCLPANLP